MWSCKGDDAADEIVCIQEDHRRNDNDRSDHSDRSDRNGRNDRKGRKDHNRNDRNHQGRADGQVVIETSRDQDSELECRVDIRRDDYANTITRMCCEAYARGFLTNEDVVRSDQSHSFPPHQLMPFLVSRQR